MDIDHDDPSTDALIDHVFVYGTLRPGDVRWSFLEPFVTDGGAADSVVGSLFDTGEDYPAATFAADGSGSTVIHGRTFRIAEPLLDDCLAVLDVEEDTVAGRYRRVAITTQAGVDVWAYEYGFGMDLVPIPSGDWFVHRPPLAPGG
ncbi:MAG: gamma-glutamylcyclotransferase [Ilumatobacteraceae bacterium]